MYSESNSHYILYRAIRFGTFGQHHSVDQIWSVELFSPRHTPNPSPLRNFVCKKLLIKNMFFFRKSMSTLEKHHSIASKTPENTLFIENTYRFWFERIWKICVVKKVHFGDFLQNPQISFLIKSIGVDKVLTKIF